MENEPIRVAQVIGKWLGGGVESVVMNYYRHIDRNKIQFDFICDDDSTNIPYDEIEKLGGRVILVPPYQKVFKYQKELKRIFKENKYKIVHSHINTLSVFPLYAAKCAKVPVRIAHSHSTTNKKEWKKNLLKQVLRPFSKVYATNYMCCSELAGRWLFGNKGYDKGNVYLLNNAIDLDKFKYDEKIRKQKRKELNINDSTLVIGHIGRFVAQKNHTFLIDIFNEVHKQNNDSLLMLVGQGPLMNEIQEKVNNLGLKDSVIFLGQRNDANELYQAMDIFVLPSLYEGLPVVGVEAQASGLLCFLSSDMTKKTKVLDSTKFMSLSNSAEEWANEILKSFKSYKKRDTNKEVSKYGFDINEETSKLELRYKELSKEKVLFFADSLEVGGIQSILKKWAYEIRNNNIEPEFLTLDYGYISTIEQELIDNGFKIYKKVQLNFNSPIDFYKYGRFLNDFFKNNNNYLAVHIHSSSKNFQILKYAKKYGINKRIIHSHSTSFESNNFFKRLVGFVFKYPMKKYATDFYACSKLSAKWLYGDKFVNNNKCKIINNAIDYEKFKYNNDVRNRIRKELDFNEKDIVLGNIGRLVSVKNQMFLIKVMNDLKKENSNYKLIIIGTGTLYESLMENIKKFNLENNIILLGERNDINDIFQAIDIFLLPSLYEGIPMVLIEAQASGTKCLVSDRVSKEAKITDDLQFVSIDDGTNIWIEKILKTNIIKSNNEKYIIENHYDLKSTIELLIKEYKGE